MKKISLYLGICILLSSCSVETVVQTPTVDTFFYEQPSVILPENYESEEKYEDVPEVLLVSALEVSEYFQEYDGTAIFYSPNYGEYVYNDEKANMYFSPYSTFKIVSTLIGLEEEIVSTAESKMSYNGTTYWNENWNRDLTLRESFQSSCVWFYHQMLYQLEPSVIQRHLYDLHYGNCDISAWKGSGSNSVSELNGFWLNSSLQITPREQVYLLEKIFQGETVYSKSQIDLLKGFMETDTGNIFGKSGGGNNQSWFVGFFEQDSAMIYFSVFMESDVTLSTSAKEVAFNLINQSMK